MSEAASYKPQTGRAYGSRMNYRLIILAAALVCGASPVFAGPRAVIELFTSQGCSSCPPADRLLGEMSRDPSLLTMSLPVDYWDYLGWKDTLALHGHTKRQHAYALARGVNDVGTPQAVINGVVAVLGSDRQAIEHAIEQSRRSGEALSLPVALKIADGLVTVAIPAAVNAKHSGEVWLCPVTDRIAVAIGRGENRGRTITYHEVVRRWVKLGDWNGSEQTFTYKLADIPERNLLLRDVDRLDVLVQSGVAAKPGLILGAASTKLP